MGNKIRPLGSDEAVSLEQTGEKLFMPHITFTVGEFIEGFKHRLGGGEEVNQKWLKEGIDCKVLTPNKGWQKGKVKITLQFVSDEPDESESPLDDIRRMNLE